MRTLVLDLINSHDSHLMINATFIKILTELQSISDKTYLLLPLSQLEQPIIANCKYIKKEVVRLPLCSDNKSLFKLQNFPAIALLVKIKKTLSEIKRIKPDRILLLAADNTFTPLLINYLCSKNNSDYYSIYIIIHNNLENLRNSKIKQIIWKKVESVPLQSMETNLKMQEQKL